MKILIKTFAGLEEVLAAEVKALGGVEVSIRKRGVACEGNLEFVYKANFQLRTALRVLIPLVDFTARNERELYQKAKQYDWQHVLSVYQTFAIDNTIFSEYFNHSGFAALKVKDAIADYFRDKTGKRPSVDAEKPDVLLNVHAYKDQFTISLDSSGEPLNQRGYRAQGHAAPLNEVLAAGMVALTGWKPDQPLLDPFCGTGTILIEAAMMASNTPPQLKREQFGFKNWNSFDPMLWSRVKSMAMAAIRKPPLQIFGGDIDPKAIAMAKKSASLLGLKEITWREGSFDQHNPKIGDGMIITNPPYGERIGSNVEELYKQLGGFFKHKFPGYTAWVLSSNKAALKQLGLRPSERILLFNGKLDCEFCSYSLIAGAMEKESMASI